jgi:hypothetical protein
MDAEDPPFILTLDQLVNQKEWYIPQLDIWYTAYTLKMFLITEITIYFGVLLILVITGHSYILYGPY